jgi:murein DD-endopeptidase MepM/ murein hydrolase activator NlpD
MCDLSVPRRRMTLCLVAAVLLSGGWVVNRPSVAAAAGKACPVAVRPSYTDDWGACRGKGCRRRHKGNDLFVPEGTPIRAVADGVVRTDDVDRYNPRSGTDLGGITITLHTWDGYVVYYAHNQRNVVRGRSVPVRQGQVIARSGKSGNARWALPHLHIQLKRSGEPWHNPYRFVRRWCGPSR